MTVTSVISFITLVENTDNMGSCDGGIPLFDEKSRYESAGDTCDSICIKACVLKKDLLNVEECA